METNKAKLDAAYSHLKNYCGVLFLLLSFTVNAQTVGSEKAIEVAKRFYNSTLAKQTSLKSAINTNISLAKTEEFISESNNLKSATSSPAYHIINVGDNEGFIIVSGDERANPILGYSMNGHYDTENIPDQLKAFLGNYKEEISQLVSVDNEFKVKPNLKWAELTTAETKSAQVAEEFFLINTKWEQGKYYNELCPEEPKAQSAYAGHAPAGCVAVAVSQIMKYWAWPKIGTDENCYTPVSSKQYGELCANFETEYKWEAMPEKLTESNSELQHDEVSKLIYHTAVATKTDFIYYGSSASSSSARNALKKYFNYSTKAQLVYKNRYSEQEWIELLKLNLNNGVPMFYRGDDDGNFGHAFICDGYDTENRFHFNWGWGGSYDGFFSLNAVTPRSNYNFSFNQGAIINIFPDYEDYAVENATLAKSQLSDGETIDISVDQVYNGYDFNEISAKFGYYISESDTIDGNEIVLNEEYINLSSSDNRKAASLNFEIPEGTKYGNYFLIVIADVRNRLAEADETNNFVALPFTYSEPTINDFMVENASASFDKSATIGNSTIQSGENLLLSCIQSYNGTANIDIYQKSGYFLSEDQQYDVSDILLGEGISSLSKNKTSEEITLQVNIPNETTSGTYYILFVSDYINEFDETNEDNNTSSIQVEIKKCLDVSEPNNSLDFSYAMGNTNSFFEDNLCIQQEDEDWFSINIYSKTYYIKIGNVDVEMEGNYGLEVERNGKLS